MPPLTRSRARALAAGGLGVIVVAAVYHAIDSIGGPDAVRETYGAWGFAVSFVAHWVLNLTPLGGSFPPPRRTEPSGDYGLVHWFPGRAGLLLR